MTLWVVSMGTWSADIALNFIQSDYLATLARTENTAYKDMQGLAAGTLRWVAFGRALALLLWLCLFSRLAQDKRAVAVMIVFKIVVLPLIFASNLSRGDGLGTDGKRELELAWRGLVLEFVTLVQSAVGLGRIIQLPLVGRHWVRFILANSCRTWLAVLISTDAEDLPEASVELT